MSVSEDHSTATPAIETVAVSRSFGSVQALTDVSLEVRPSEIRALLGPNGAGKTTLLRIIIGLVEPETGVVVVDGEPVPIPMPKQTRRRFGMILGGGRSFYLRITGFANLVFFARLYGMSLDQARRRAEASLAEVGLEDAAHRRANTYSEGMIKRLAIARALIHDPPILLLDEATHGLDPGAARNTRDLVAAAAERGIAVLWATQLIDEIRGFAHSVTLLHKGSIRFSGSVPELMARSTSQAYVVKAQSPDVGEARLLDRAQAILSDRGIVAADASGHLLIRLRNGFSLGDAITALVAGGVQVSSCREERSGIEEAFMLLTEDGAP